MTTQQQHDITTARTNALNANNLAQNLRVRLDHLESTLSQVSQLALNLNLRLTRLEQLMEDQGEE